MGRQDSRYSCLAVLLMTASLFAAPDGLPVTSRTAAQSPADTRINLFGQPPVEGSAAAILPEGQREIHRPDTMPRPANTRGEGQAVVRRAGGLSWNWADLLPLAAVLAVIAIVAMVIKRFAGGKRLLGGSNLLEVIARTPVAPRQTLMLVRMGRRMLLLGVTNSGINTLCIVDQPDQVAELLGDAASARPGSMTDTFYKSFTAEAERFTGERGDDSIASAGGQVRGLLEKVRRLGKGRDVA